MIIDARPKKAASTYSKNEETINVGFDFGDMPEINLSGLEDIDWHDPEFHFDDVKWE